MVIYFKELLRDAILREGTRQHPKKTETRRIWDRQRVKIGAIHQARVKRFSSDPPFAWLRILDVYKERLGAINTEGARAEGFMGTETFKQYWIDEIHGIWEPELLVYVVKFLLARIPNLTTWTPEDYREHVKLYAERRRCTCHGAPKLFENLLDPLEDVPYRAPQHVEAWPNPPCPGVLQFYPHSSGWPVLRVPPPFNLVAKYWIYVVCSKCGYEWAIRKLMKKNDIINTGRPEHG